MEKNTYKQCFTISKTRQWPCALKKRCISFGTSITNPSDLFSYKFADFFLKKKKQQQLELSFSRIFFLFIECLENGANLIWQFRKKTYTAQIRLWKHFIIICSVWSFLSKNCEKESFNSRNSSYEIIYFFNFVFLFFWIFAHPFFHVLDYWL